MNGGAAVGPVETGHLVPAARQEPRYPGTRSTPIPGDQNAHPAIIPPDRQSGAAGQLPTRAPGCAAPAAMLRQYPVDDVAGWGGC